MKWAFAQMLVSSGKAEDEVGSLSLNPAQGRVLSALCPHYKGEYHAGFMDSVIFKEKCSMRWANNPL